MGGSEGLQVVGQVSFKDLWCIWWLSNPLPHTSDISKPLRNMP